MTRLIRSLIGLALIAAAAVLAGWAIYGLIRTGTCGDGGPYISARPCPPGTDLKIIGLIGAVFATIAGAVISPVRGSGRLAWGLGFTLMGAGALVAAFGPAKPPDGGIGLTIVGVALGCVFGAMGLPGLIGAVFAGAGRAAAAELMSSGDSSVTTIDLSGSELDPAQAKRVGDVLGSLGMGELATTLQQHALNRGSTTVAASSSDLTAELTKLAELRTGGALTQAEFDQAKKKLLGL